jgi:hypothetical protein
MLPLGIINFSLAVALDMNIANRKYIKNINKKYLLKLGIVLLNVQEYIICFLGNISLM